jgi:dipeptidyl-peptidase-3
MFLSSSPINRYHYFYMNIFNYSDEKFADLQLLRYRLKDFDKLSLRQKTLIYYLSKASLYGRDIITDQNGSFNLRIRKALEAVYKEFKGDRTCGDFAALTVYLKRLWFSNGIYHHYGCEKFKPEFSETFFRNALHDVDKSLLPLNDGESVDEFIANIFPVVFNTDILSKRVVKAGDDDLVKASACNYYENVSQQEASSYYAAMAERGGDEQPSYGLNSKLVKHDGRLQEIRWTTNGMYGSILKKIVFWLEQAKTVCENEQQAKVISLLIKYYETGDLKLFDDYSIEWLKEQQGDVDFINGFIEVYGDPLGIKGSWEGLVEYKDMEATRRIKIISDNAQWFEDNSPTDIRFHKPKVTGISLNVICAAMLGGDEYPSSAIGINLPNADWIRARYGSKSVMIGNLTEAYDMAAKGNGFYDEFVVDDFTRNLIDKYGDVCDDLHTDLHECLGHGSGRLMPGVSPNALKAYGNTIEEARADLFALYYLADDKLIELGLLSSKDAYKSEYYTYMMNGLLTQMVRIKPGQDIEEDHMRNRAIIAQWSYRHSTGAVKLEKRNGKTYLLITDYQALRKAFAELLTEIQRIKSEGDFNAAKQLVETYGIHLDEDLHNEMLERYKKLDIAPYKGFINPWLKSVNDTCGNIVDVEVDYTETFEHQMLRYSKEYN